MTDKKSMEEAKQEQMQDQNKGGENRVKDMKEEQQRKIDKEAPDASGK